MNIHQLRIDRNDDRIRLDVLYLLVKRNKINSIIVVRNSPHRTISIEVGITANVRNLIADLLIKIEASLRERYR